MVNTEKGITVLSLCDGISVAQLALKQLGIKVDKYYSVEIDPNPIKITQHHFPNTVQLGDIKKINAHELPKVDLVVSGPSCQNLSIMNSERLGLAGSKSSIFYDAVKILNIVRQKNSDCLFLFENVQMPKKDKQIFIDLLGEEPLAINSGLLGSTLRNRLYFTNIKNIEVPKPKNIYLNDIIENGCLPPNTKGKCVLTKTLSYTIAGLRRHLIRSIGNVVYLDEVFCNLSKSDKLIQLDQLTDNQIVKELFRPMTIRELCIMQTLPKNYVSTNIISKTASIKALGNCFTLDAVKFILSHADFKQKNNYEYNTRY